MLKVLFIVIFLCGFSFPVNLVVEPYLQNATPNSINILWETDSDSQTIVEWGLSPFLTESTRRQPVELSVSRWT